MTTGTSDLSADIAKAAKIIGQGPGWVGRLREAVAAGAVLPAVGAFLFSQQSTDDRPSGKAEGLLTRSGS